MDYFITSVDNDWKFVYLKSKVFIIHKLSFGVCKCHISFYVMACLEIFHEINIFPLIQRERFQRERGDRAKAAKLRFETADPFHFSFSPPNHLPYQDCLSPN